MLKVQLSVCYQYSNIKPAVISWRLIIFQGIARRLVKAALKEAAKKREMRYSDLKKIDRGIRRHFHDDITVIVVFLDPTMISKNFYHGPVLSLKGAGVPV